MANETYDLVVIGGGPAGYAAAIRAGQLGKKVACIELERAGGTCLNWGCIPSKALLKAAEIFHSFEEAKAFGINVETAPTVDFAKVMARSRTVADQMAKGIEFLFRKNKVDYFVGHARISVPGIVEIVEGRDKGTFFKTEQTLVATGCRSRRLPNIEVDGKRVMTSREALAMKTQPKSIVILGGGAIGVEFAYFLSTLGTKVTLVEMLDRIVPVEDEDISEALFRSFKKQGIDVRQATKAENIAVGKDSVKLDLVKGDKRETVEVETLLLSIGVVPNLEGLLSPRVKLEMDRGYIKVDDTYQTSVPGIYAAGDIIGAPWLAHVATYEAVQAVNGMFTSSKPKRVTDFPGCTYCHPQIASVGLTEAKAKERGINYKVGRFPFSASGKAVAINQPEGFVKLILDDRHGELLGAHSIGENATQLMGEYVLAQKAELTAEDIHSTIHAHPTMSEALMEAAAAAYDEAIHI